MNGLQRAILSAGLAVWTFAAVAQDAPPLAGPDPRVLESESSRSNVDSLEALLKSLRIKQQETARIQQQLQAAADEVTHAELLDRLRKSRQEESEIQDQIERFAVEVDTSLFRAEPEKKFDWQEEVGGLIRPILAELKSATADSRAIGELRSRIEVLGKQFRVADDAVRNLEELVAAGPSPELRQHLEQELAAWTRRRDDVRNQQTALQLQLDSRLAQRSSFLDETTGYARKFFQTRGQNILLGLGAFCIVFFGIRLLNFLVHKLRPARPGKSFTSRLGALVSQILSIVGGLLATLLVFNLAGDWFLLGLVIIFLAGVGWAGMKALPQYVETAKLMLNIGAVKEGERLLYDGIPWKVDSLGFSARLVNPRLDGGLQLLPVKYLVGLHSRPNGEQEDWFPTRAGDWVVLADGRFGRIAAQTPSAVRLVELGGSQVVYQTPAFLALNARALSSNFRVTVPFGIDYQHQALCTTEIPARMKAKLESGLTAALGPDPVKRIAVEFKQAGASSLDYEVMVDFDGALAERYEELSRRVAALLVDACNEHGWEIPFTQLTVHQAG